MFSMKNISMNEKYAGQASSWAQWFDRCADYYKDPRMKMSYYKDGKTGQPVSKTELQAIHKDVWRKIDAKPDSRILDVGSGIGLFIQAFQNKVKKMVGIDISLNMMKDASALNPKGIFLQCTVSRLPFSPNSFDRILCYSVFHYLKDNLQAEQTLREFCRITKKDGMIFIGDLLLPSPKPGNLPQKKLDPSNKKTKKWWPSILDHSLEKKSFDPKFFLTYCKTEKLKCDILRQDIKSKPTSSSRYDVLIKFK